MNILEIKMEIILLIQYLQGITNQVFEWMDWLGLRLIFQREKIKNYNNLKDKIDYLCEKLRLNEFINKITGELSSGQKNRVSLAKSIINDPSVLLLDEPTASLDPETGDFVRSFLEEYQKEKKTSILLASHNMAEVERLCSSVLMMNKGSIIDQGTPGELIKKHGRRNMEEVFLKLTRDLI